MTPPWRRALPPRCNPAPRLLARGWCLPYRYPCHLPPLRWYQPPPQRLHLHRLRRHHVCRVRARAHCAVVAPVTAAVAASTRRQQRPCLLTCQLRLRYRSAASRRRLPHLAPRHLTPHHAQRRRWRRLPVRVAAWRLPLTCERRRLTAPWTLTWPPCPVAPPHRRRHAARLVSHHRRQPRSRWALHQHQRQRQGQVVTASRCGQPSLHAVKPPAPPPQVPSSPLLSSRLPLLQPLPPHLRQHQRLFLRRRRRQRHLARLLLRRHPCLQVRRRRSAVGVLPHPRLLPHHHTLLTCCRRRQAALTVCMLPLPHCRPPRPHCRPAFHGLPVTAARAPVPTVGGTAPGAQLAVWTHQALLLALPTRRQRPCRLPPARRPRLGWNCCRR